MDELTPAPLRHRVLEQLVAKAVRLGHRSYASGLCRLDAPEAEPVGVLISAYAVVDEERPGKAVGSFAVVARFPVRSP